jgi:hypothetical protein
MDRQLGWWMKVFDDFPGCFMSRITLRDANSSVGFNIGSKFSSDIVMQAKFVVRTVSVLST